MSVCKCPGECLVGSMTGFSGEGQGQKVKTAIQNAYRNSGLTESYYVLMKLAFRWECEDNCQIRTRFSIDPMPQTRQNPNTEIWHADLENATLKVWVECTEPIEA